MCVERLFLSDAVLVRHSPVDMLRALLSTEKQREGAKAQGQEYCNQSLIFPLIMSIQSALDNGLFKLCNDLFLWFNRPGCKQHVCMQGAAGLPYRGGRCTASTTSLFFVT